MKPLSRRSVIMYVENRTGFLHLSYKNTGVPTVTSQLKLLLPYKGCKVTMFPHPNVAVTGRVVDITSLQLILADWDITHDR